jgi:uncharacterized membrane protein
MSPFDIKSALLAKHAQHVVLIHFPIALFLVGAACDVLGRSKKCITSRETLVNVARFNIVAAAFFVPPTLATGIMAWWWQLNGKKLKGLLLLHLCLGCAAGILICTVAALRFRQRDERAGNSAVWVLLLEVVTTVVVVLAAHVGGFLSGVNFAG